MVVPQLPSARRPGTKRSKNQRDASASLPPLPEEILIEIFARLPAKTVGRFRCLSRSWAGALSSASFVDLHHQQANQQQAGLPPNILFTTAQRCLQAWRDGRPVLHPLTGDAALSLLPQLDHDRALRVLTAKPCHGLVLLQRWPWHGHYVCNPSTGALSPLPDTKMPSRMCHRYILLPNTFLNCVSYGLGYNPAAKEHKVVRLFYLDGGRSAAAVDHYL
ncbi:putative F-box protein At1g53550 [Lolium perenne]|uniref:putative F-box protein At1g53550 n=1 Tax=Lolium perenne TaxID=4522 RepID=UPI0021F629AF|nr:putative F-box protein At2g16220 [Lolium perenne]